ncbi:MAG TPA: HAD-IIIC family phosphatase [Burkholderiaceae bacterium]
MEMAFPEGVRLVIWDLDQTFWSGTLTEGEISWIDEHEHVVKTLAARGIVSSICSKNDMAHAMGVLQERKLDSYFIFPSIDWTAKGNRIKGIIENVQLRPETVLFIDDNHLNRAEAADLNPGLNVASEQIIPTLLDHPQCRGKEDSGLTRLAQYKMMEQRKRDASGSGTNEDDFLRHSGIKVFIDYDLEGNIDRCVEMINRTNQLNFTKKRLSPNTEQAKKEFLEELRDARVQGGLIHCRDKYGDHGYVGLYLASEGRMLKHFLFSCRVLGMGVEQWLYKRLGKPWLQIEGEVLSDPRDESRNVDWIELAADKGESEAAPAEMKIDKFYVLGGCIMENIGHYLQVFSKTVIHEGNERRDGMDFRRTHTSYLAYGDWLPNSIFFDAVARLGCRREDFSNRIFEADEKSALVLSFWYDQISPLYRHRAVPIEMPFLIDGIRWDEDVTKKQFHEMPADFRSGANAERIFHYFKHNFIYNGYVNPGSYKNRVNSILNRIHAGIPIFLLDLPGADEEKWSERQVRRDMIEAINGVHKELAAERRNIVLIDPLEFVQQPEDRMDWWHFDRKVYYRIFQRIKSLISAM